MSELDEAISNLLALNSAALFEIAEAMEGGVLRFGFSAHLLSVSIEQARGTSLLFRAIFPGCPGSHVCGEGPTSKLYEYYDDVRHPPAS